MKNRMNIDQINSIKLFVFFTIFLISSSIYSQNEYLMTISNAEFTDENVYEFELYIQSTGSDFTLTSYQCAFNFNEEILNVGDVSFEYIEGSSNMINTPVSSLESNSADEVPTITFASIAGGEMITSNETKVGRFRIRNTHSFITTNPSLTWDFEGYIQTILTGENYVDITNPLNHVSTITGVEENISEIPSTYALNQNYPNPFNPSTTINFSLKEKGQVNLIVYNMIGEKVSELVSEEMGAGSHQINFDGSNLASGAYIYRLDVENKFNETRKMMLVK